MESYFGYDDEDVDEDEEMSRYGLKNDDEDSDDERQEAIEEMFMRIHYGADVEEEKGDAPKSALTSDEENDISHNKGREKRSEDSNKRDIDLNPLPVRSVNKVMQSKESTINDNLNNEIRQKKGRSDIVEGNNKRNMSNKLDDSGVIIITDQNDEDLDSKYSVKKRDVGSTSSDYDKSVIVLDNSVTDAFSTDLEECNVTVNVSSSDSDSDVCVIQNPPKPEVVIDLSDSPAKPSKETGPATSLVVKINRKSSMAESNVIVPSESAKQRTWKAKGGLPLQNRTNRSMFEISSDSIKKALRENKSKNSSKERTPEGSSDSESDCMVIESMSEDENMDFNFVTPLGMKRSEVTAEKDTDSASRYGPGSKGPQCVKCRQFGHTVRYCPKPKSDNVIKPPTNRYFQPETDQSDSTNNSNQNKSLRCLNCHEMGHLARNCPEPKRIPTCVLCGEKGHFDLVCPDALCFKCNLPGHRAKECKRRKLVKYAWCQRCQLQGHDVQMCPDAWRQYHLTMEEDDLVRFSQNKSRSKTNLYCCNCGLKGHHAFDCLGERMDGHTTAVFPHVWIYDPEFHLYDNDTGPSSKTTTKKKGKNKAKKNKAKKTMAKITIPTLKNSPLISNVTDQGNNLRTKLNGRRKSRKSMRMDRNPCPDEHGLTRRDRKKLRFKRKELRRKQKLAEYMVKEGAKTEGLSRSQVRVLQTKMKQKMNEAKKYARRMIEETQAKKEGRFEEYLKERNAMREDSARQYAAWQSKKAARIKAKKEEKKARKQQFALGEFV